MIVFALLASGSLFGQVTITNKGTIITILPGTRVDVQGSYVNETRYPTEVDDPQFYLMGDLYISGDITNNAGTDLVNLEYSVGGNLILNGGTHTLVGNSPITAHNLKLDAATGVTLARDLVVAGQLTFTTGRINLQAYHLDLGTSGMLVNETTTNRIYTTGTGTVDYTLSAQPHLTDALGNIGLRLAGDLPQGTQLHRGHRVQAGAGNGSVARYFDVDMAAGDVIDALRFYYLDAELSGIVETDLSLYASYDGGTSWKKIGGTVNVAGNYIELSGAGIDKDVRLTLSGKDCTTPVVVDIGPATRDVCAGATVTFDAGNVGSTYVWSTSATTQKLEVAGAGTYSVRVTNARGCEGTDAVVVTGRPTPTAAFTTNVACPGTGMNFTNASTVASGALTYAWDFADPASGTDVSTDQHPTYNYATAGNYTVRFIARTAFQCADTLLKAVTVFPQPVADFTFTTACLGQSTVFTNASTIASGGMTYAWDFDDGTTSTLKDPQRQFASLASYDVKLTARSNANCIHEITKAVTLSRTPVAAFTVTEACVGNSVSLVNQSSLTGGGAMTYAWDLGDATNSSATTPAKSYAAAGTYTIALTATGSGCSNTTTHVTTIHANPVALFSAADQCQDKSVTFVNSSLAGEGTVTYAWNFADGNTSTLKDPSHAYAAPGAYSVSLKATNSAGCVDTENASVDVFPVPMAGFTFSNACEEQTVSLNNTSTVLSGTLSYAWNISDGTSATTQHVQKAFATAGTYDVSLVATSDQGCSAKKDAVLTIYAVPVLSFGGAISTCGDQYTLDADNAGSSYLWSTGSTAQQLHVTTNGTYSVTVTNSHACTVTESVDIVLKGAVAPNLGLDRAACGSLVVDAGYPGASYVWSTGETSRTVTVTSSGLYSVQVLDPNGCAGTDEVDITVNPVPVVNLGTDVEVCADIPVVLDAGNPGQRYAWSNLSAGQTLRPAASGLYSVVVTNGFGCNGADAVDVIIHSMPVNTLPASINACDRLVLDAGNAGASYQWSDLSSSQALAVTASGTYRVTVTTPAQCVSQFTSAVVINASAVVELGRDQELCYGQAFSLDAGGQGDSYRWSDGSTGRTVMATQSGLYTVDVTRNNGCVTHDEVMITVFPEITNALQPRYFLCVGSARVLDAASPQGVSYAWADANGFLSAEPSFAAANAGAFRVVTTDALGCTRSTDVTVETDPDPITAQFLVATLADVGDSLYFVQLSYPDPVVYGWDFGDGVTAADSDPVHMYLRSGDFDAGLQVGDPGGCTNAKSKGITIRLLRSDGEQQWELPYVEVIRSHVYPNPAPDAVSVGLTLSRESEIMIVLYSPEGRALETRHTTVQDGSIVFDLRHYRAGLYMIRVFINNEAHTLKVIKL